MIRSELYKIFHTKRSCILIFILLILPFYDLCLNIYRCFQDFWSSPEYYNYVLSPDYILHPSQAGFLSASSEGHVSQIIYFWLFPIYVLVIYADSIIREKHTNYANPLIGKNGAGKYFQTKFVVAFCLFFLISFISFTVNYIVASCVFREGISFRGLELYTKGFLGLTIQYPVITYCLYILSASFVSGCCGCFGVAVCILFSDYKYAYPICFFAWMLLFMIPNFSDLSALIQPFTESRPGNIRDAFVFLLLIIGGSVGAVRLLRYKRDVL